MQGDAYRMRKEYLQRLLDMTRKQKVLLEVEDYEEFIRVLDERQEYIDAIEKYNKENDAPLSEEELEILKKLIAQDKANHTEYNRQMLEAQTKLKQLNQNQNREDKYFSAYATYAQGRYFDHK